MKKLTKKQRHEIYKKALDNLENEIDSHLGLCYLISFTMSDHFGYIRNYCNDVAYRVDNCILKEYDLFFYNEDAEYFYFEGNIEDYYDKEVRKLVLMFCIEMTR